MVSVGNDFLAPDDINNVKLDATMTAKVTPRHQKNESYASSLTIAGRRYGQPISERSPDDAVPYESVFVKFDLDTAPQIGIQHSADPQAPERLETFSYAKLPAVPQGGPLDGRFQGGPDELLCVRLDRQDFFVEHYTPPNKAPRIKALSFQRFEAPPPPPPREEPRLINLAIRDETGIKSFVVLQTWPFASLVDAYVRFYRHDPNLPRPTFKLDGMKAWERINEETSIHDVGIGWFE